MSLIHWWPLTKDAKDKIDDNFISGALNLQDGGKVGQKCARQNSAQLTLTNSPALSNLVDFSIAMWVRLSSANNSVQWRDLFGVELSNGTITHPFRAEINSTGGSAFSIYNNTIAGTDGGAANFNLTKDEWCHLVITKEKGNITSYVNGTLSNTTNWINLNSAYATGEFHISDSGMYCDYNDVRIYNHILSKKEIKELSRALVLHYNFNDPCADTSISDIITDNSGYSNNATLTRPEDYSFVTDHIQRGSRALKIVSGNPAAKINTILNPSFIAGQGTVCLWYKKDSSAFNTNNGDFLVATPVGGGGYFGAMNSTSIWHHNASHTNFYIDGQPTTNASSVKDTNWHFYVFTGVDLSKWNSFSMHSHGDDAWLYRGYIGDFKIYNTILTQDEVRDIYKSAQSIDRNGNEYVSEIDECSNISTVTRSSSHKVNYLSEIIQLDDGSHWIQIQHHNNRAGTNMMPTYASGNSKFDYSTNFVYNNDESWAGFHLVNCNGIRPNDNEWEFLSIENIKNTDKIAIRQWGQRVNPFDIPANEEGYNTSIANSTIMYQTNIDTNTHGVMRRSPGGAVFCITRKNEPGHWFGAFGCWSNGYNSGVPTFLPDGDYSRGIFDLYMRIDPTKIRYREFSDGIIMPNTIYEN